MVWKSTCLCTTADLLCHLCGRNKVETCTASPRDLSAAVMSAGRSLYSNSISSTDWVLDTRAGDRYIHQASWPREWIHNCQYFELMQESETFSSCPSEGPMLSPCPPPLSNTYPPNMISTQICSRKISKRPTTCEHTPSILWKPTSPVFQK